MIFITVSAIDTISNIITSRIIGDNIVEMTMHLMPVIVKLMQKVSPLSKSHHLCYSQLRQFING